VLRRIHREHGVERFPQPAEVQIDAGDLTAEEKALVLFRHAIIALAEATEQEQDARASELDALAGYTLDLLARHWDDRHEPLPVGLLARWLELRVLVAERPPLPSLAATWIEALPSPAREQELLDAPTFEHSDERLVMQVLRDL